MEGKGPNLSGSGTVGSDEVSTALIAIALTLCAVFLPSAFISGISPILFDFATLKRKSRWSTPVSPAPPQVALPHLRDPFAADANRDALADPFGYSDLRGAAAEQQADSTARPMVGVVLKTLADGKTPDWEATVMPSGSRIQRAHRCCRSVAYPLRACELSTRHNTLVTEIGDH